jgi:hypothetical protein
MKAVEVFKACISFMVTVFQLLLVTETAYADWSIDVESGLAFSGYNDVRIPGKLVQTYRSLSTWKQNLQNLFANDTSTTSVRGRCPRLPGERAGLYLRLLVQLNRCDPTRRFALAGLSA